MAQSMYPSSMELDDPSPEVENLLPTADSAPSQHVPHHLPDHLNCFCLFASIKEGESTSGSGHERFYTPEPSPTDQDSSSSGV